MTHKSAQLFFLESIELIKEKLPEDIRVIEIGSYDVNGSIRGIFNENLNCSSYVGVDLTDGPGVDLIASGDEINLPAKSFDLVISSECLEHNPRYVGTLYKMKELVNDGGYVIISCATIGRLEHGTARSNPRSSPGTQSKGWNYYKNLKENDFPPDFLDFFSDFVFLSNKKSYDLYFIGSTKHSLARKFRDGSLECIEFHERPNLVAFLTLEFPLSVFRSVCNEKIFQLLGCNFINMRSKLINFLKLHISN